MRELAMAVVVLWVIVLLLSLLVLGLCAFVYQLVREHGRLLVRLEAVEERFANAPPGGLLPVVGNGQQPQQPQGLAVGNELPSFQLPDFTGRLVGLADFQGERLLLVNWSPSCGFCELIAPELAELHGKLRQHATEMVLVSDGDVETNRRFAAAHGLTCPILLQDGSEPVEAFRGLGTPVAYLVDEHGRVAEPLAVGAEQVPVLARQAASAGKRRLPGQKSLRHSRIEREGLKVGTPAPVFTLPDIHGNRVRLEAYRGRRVLLVFTDPQCGPCDALAGELARLHERHHQNGLGVVMVGRGELEENRHKAEAHGIQFPVVVQQQWKLSKQYGIFATPVAFLIDEEGTIAADVAQGAEQVLALARQGLAGKGAGR
jgi:peroxiredoxin